MDLPVQHSTHSKNATTLRYKSELLTYVVHSVVHSVVVFEPCAFASLFALPRKDDLEFPSSLHLSDEFDCISSDTYRARDDPRTHQNRNISDTTYRFSLSNMFWCVY